MFYFTAYCESLDEDYVCKYSKNLKKGDVVVFDACSSFVTAIIKNSLDELDVLLNDYYVKDVIQYIDVTAYKNQKAAMTKKALLKKQLSERSKEVKELECFKKLSGTDPVLKDLLEQFQKLENFGKESDDKEIEGEEKGQ